MLFFSAIPESYLSEIQRIERVSNPHVWTAENIKDSYFQFLNLGAFVDEQLVAFVLYQMILDEGEIIHLVCDKTHQGKGYANALLVELKKQLAIQGVEQLFLEVREDNVIAQQLYQRLGFETVGRRENYYSGRHDALIQRLHVESL